MRLKYSAATHSAHAYYQKGHDACSKGFPLMYCPYDRRTVQGKAWASGWNDQMKDTLREKVEKRGVL